VNRFLSREVLWFGLIAWVVVVLAEARISEADLWYHLRNAEYLVTTGSFLRADPYTFTAAGSPIVNYEWLAELAYYGGYRIAGLRGLVAVSAVVLATIFGGVFYLARRASGDRLAAFVVTMAGLALASYSFGPRMMHFGWLCLVALLILLERFDRQPRVAWLIPPLLILWINLHGSWVFGFVVLATVILGRVARGEWRGAHPEHARLRSLVAATVVAAAVLPLNPYGLAMVRYPFDFWLQMSAAVSVVVEWQSVNFQGYYGMLVLALVIGLLVLAMLKPSAWTVEEILLTAFALWAALSHVRFAIFAGIVLPPIVARRLTFIRSSASGNKPWVNLILLTALVGIVIRTVPSERKLAERIANDFPKRALDFMRQQGINGRVFNAYDFGGYIEWYAPWLRTFADGRTDIFVANGTFADYLDIVMWRNSLALLDKHAIDYVLHTPGTPLVYLLDQSPRWRLRYSDGVSRLYQRSRDSTAAPTPP
jgi:hypothetical protein